MLELQVQRLKPGGGFRQLGKDTPAIGNLITNAIAEDYARFVRERYLSGQVLGVQSGQTRASVRFFKEDVARFGVRPGVGVKGRLNYLLKFERGDRPFMEPSFREYQSTRRHLEIMQRITNAMFRKKLR